jgi:hypothetical protein
VKITGVTQMAQFEGKSESGNLQEALDDAIGRACRSELRAELKVSYQVTKISGVRGGIDATNQIVVVIDAEIH